MTKNRIERKIKWLAILVPSACIAISGLAFADTPIYPTSNDSGGTCSNYMQQASNGVPPVLTKGDTDGIQSCLSQCSQFYDTYEDQGNIDQMAAGISFCRTSLSNLYYEGVYQQANANLSAQDSSSSDSNVSTTAPSNYQSTTPTYQAPATTTPAPQQRNQQKKDKQSDQGIRWF